MSSDEERLSQVEESVIKLNHFTESFPELMKVKLGAISDQTKLNRNLILIVLAGLVTGVLGLLFYLLKFTPA